MRALYIDRRNAALGYRDAALELRVGSDGPVTIPLRGLERLIIGASAMVSTGLLAQCWERDIGVLILSGRRADATARFYGAPHNDATLRVEQALASRNPAQLNEFARRIVGAKLTAQARFLRRLGDSRPGGRAHVQMAVTLCTATAATLGTGQIMTLDAIRGYEGAVAASYFAALAHFMPPNLGFTGRQRRPPRDPVNAALSLGYVLASFEAGRQAQIVGLDPKIGALHALAFGRDSLALDLVEPARPKIDGLVQGLFQQRLLRADHFKSEPDGAVLLGKAGRAIFYQAWEDQAGALSRYLRLAAREAARSIRAAQQPRQSQEPTLGQR